LLGSWQPAGEARHADAASQPRDGGRVDRSHVVRSGMATHAYARGAGIIAGHYREEIDRTERKWQRKLKQYEAAA